MGFKRIKWMNVFLIAVLTVAMLGGCKTADVEESASADSWVEVKDEEQTKTEETLDQPTNETSKEEVSLNDKNKPSEETPETKEPEQVQPEQESPVEKEPSEETTKQPEEEEPAPVEKESSGTAITFLSQNVKHAGEKAYGEKGDGTDSNIYNRLRRFKSLVQANDPDVIFYNEARRTAFNFLPNDPYFSQTYTMVYHYRWEEHPELGGIMGEPVLFKTAKYELLDSGHFWIAPNPYNPGHGFGDQEMADVSSWVKLKDKATGVEFYCYCAHFDPNNSAVYIPAMRLYYERFAKMEKGAYAFVGGDYNVYYRSGDYLGMMEWDQIIDLRDMAMNMKADGLCELGGMGSGHNLAYGRGEPMPEVNYKTPQIDYVMAKPNLHMAVDYYGFDYTVYDYPEEGIAAGHISDHWGLVVKVRIDTDADYSQYQCKHNYGDNPIYF
ncbi:MAG: hypothetical protein IJ333_03205 [Clostridia bacterium]|nr:hypothetical protein [Clostridia bacterium]